MATGAWKLTEEDVLEIRGLINKGLKDGVIAESYNVSREHVWKIRHNQRWAWVEPEEQPKKRSNDFRQFITTQHPPKDPLIKKVIVIYADGTRVEL